MFKKIAALGAAAALCVGLMTGCGASGTTADTSYSAENPLVRGISFLGQTSFDVYLWHCPLFSLCRLAEGLLGVRLTVTRGKMLLFLLAVEALGALLFLSVEKPLARMTKRFEWDKLKIVDPA